MSKPTDTNEPSPASAGSRPVAWAADIPGKFGAAPTLLFGYTEKLVKGIAAAGGDLVQPFPLYRSPLTLTDEEREAIKEACDEGRWYPKDYHHISAMRALLDRTK